MSALEWDKVCIIWCNRLDHGCRMVGGGSSNGGCCCCCCCVVVVVG